MHSLPIKQTVMHATTTYTMRDLQSNVLNMLNTGAMIK